MDIFEFIVGMISVILALAIAQLFIGVSDLIQRRDRVKFFLPHSVWATVLFLLAFLHWWSLWVFKDLDWNFAMFLLVSFDGPMFGTEPYFNGLRATQGVVITSISWGIVSDNRRVQTIIALVVLGSLIVGVSIRFLPGQG